MIAGVAEFGVGTEISSTAKTSLIRVRGGRLWLYAELMSRLNDTPGWFWRLSGVLKTRKWENAMTMDKQAWGFRRNARLQDFLTSRELIETLVTTVSCGGISRARFDSFTTCSPSFQTLILLMFS